MWSSWTPAWVDHAGRLWPRLASIVFVAPDNGVLSLVYEREERVSVRHITSEHYFHNPISNTFHGRDIFAPVAAYLSKGVDTAKFGDEITDYVRFLAPKPKATAENTWRGLVLKTDKFGNLITNISPKDIPQIFDGPQSHSRSPWAKLKSQSLFPTTLKAHRVSCSLF